MITPLEDRIVVRPDQAPEASPGGVILPPSAQTKPERGVVVAVGPGRRAPWTDALVPLGVEVGDIVVYSKYWGVEVSSAADPDLLILPAGEVLAVADR